MVLKPRHVQPLIASCGTDALRRVVALTFRCLDLDLSFVLFFSSSSGCKFTVIYFVIFLLPLCVDEMNSGALSNAV